MAQATDPLDIRSNLTALAETSRRTAIAHRGILVRLGAVIAGLLIWEVYTSTQPDYLFPGIRRIYGAFVNHYLHNDLLGALQDSLLSLVVGYLLAVVVGISVGFALGLNKRMELMVYPYIGAFYVAPISALVPAIILLGGSNFGTRVFVIFLFAVFEVTINVFEGVKTTPRGYFEVTRSFGASKGYAIRNVVFPYSLPYIFSGLRLAVGRAVIGLVIAEILLDFANLGALIRLSQNRFDVAGVLAIVVMLTVIAIVMTRLVQEAQSRTLTWDPEVRQ